MDETSETTVRNLCCFFLLIDDSPNRLSSTIGGNREMDQSYTTSQLCLKYDKENEIFSY